ncbi:MAG: ABC transporter ATP-binding protein [Acetobacteraceae bacterium]|nr:ABC transporter ATP-binding protein [Acetobacteraceae bacterium]
MSTSEPIARFRHVTKTYDGITAVVRDLNLDVARGEFLTLLGPSGSGKTTTLMMLAGFQTPSSGEILLQGKAVHRTPPHRRGLGVVFQSYALFPHMSVAENVAFPLTIRRVGRAERDEKVARALALVRLNGLDERRPAQLSGGQQQRVALARALVFAPELVLLDEPLGALDRALREELQMEIRHIHRALGVSMLYVTHDQTEALVLSDRIAVFDCGTVQQLASPETLYEDPANAFVARFIGDNNRLPGHIIAIADDLARVKLRAGPEVEARIADATRIGDPCIVSIRPERVALAAVSAREMGENALSVVVVEIVYLGDHLRLRLALGQETELIVKRPAVAGLGGLAVGQPASVAWQGFHARAFLPEA